jgi:aminoglycoside phosphotransferase (APT) family kinase protein
VSARAQPARGDPATLADGLCRRLPGLAAALDPDLAVARVRRRLLPPAAHVEQVSVGKVWWRDDGSCDLRYRLLVTGTGWQTVLARVPGDGSGLALRRFPHDPDLPTLSEAMDPAHVHRLLAAVLPVPPANGGRPTVEVVHHPRAGACVLRYGYAAAGFFGKVYADAAGAARSYRTLQAVAVTAARDRRRPRLPAPALYAPGLRLVVTGAVSGAPLRTRLRDEHPGPRQVERTAQAVAAAGRALASLHRLPVPLPAHTAAREAAELARELDRVAGVWPASAQRVRRALAALAHPPDDGALVLSHGDLTPSQVLLDGDTAALVDLDGLCRADPARDLGRFLAHLDLCLARTAHRPHDEAAALAAAFLGGYAGAAAAGGGRPAVPAARRVGFYRATSLARTALHACRQLKDDRLVRALSLLEALEHADGSTTP